MLGSAILEYNSIQEDFSLWNYFSLPDNNNVIWVEKAFLRKIIKYKFLIHL